MLFQAVCLSFLLLGSFGLAASINSRSSSSSDTYSLYAFGDNIGGLAMYYADGNAVISKSTPSNATAVGQVAFTRGSSPPLEGNPANSTSPASPSNSASASPSSGSGSGSGSTNSTNNPPFSNQQLFIPGPNSKSHKMGFTKNPSTGQVTTKFVWYGHFLLVEADDGGYTSLFYAKKSGSNDGAYSMHWNITDDEDGEFIPISMRSIAPSNE